jgi:hypothetical protein
MVFLFAPLHVLKQMVKIFASILLLPGCELGVALSYHSFEKLGSYTVLVKLIRLILSSSNFLCFNCFTVFSRPQAD